ncbi:GNAT family N-acetyltransferase [Anaeromassilibacillus senegalensis]|uniref:GNAT family N-acetyltransferase n=1 Tax=Anaeromassilibacillus senegalensis TaxID=1673717 RepID=UPI001A9A67ED|nr:GNAT family N-acetyltransferase [Anaeromassilibacillus senegalensis]
MAARAGRPPDAGASGAGRAHGIRTGGAGSHWRRGLGGLLTRELLAQAARMGYEQVELEVDCENGAARALYESCGFREYGVLERAFLLRNGTCHDECRMVCRLR